MKTTLTTNQKATLKWSAVVVVLGVCAGAAFVTRAKWLPKAQELYASITSSKKKNGEAHAEEHDHAGHDHAGHDEGNSLELTPQGRKNAGIVTAKVKLQPYTRSISMPAMVVGRSGRSQVEVTAPLGGRVMRVYAIQGDAVEPGQPLFDLRLTHEELVQAQSELLRSAEQLDVELREIRRLETLAATGAIPGKRLLERKYEKQKIEAIINAQKQSLLLHGLTKEQVSDIVVKRKLLQDITVVAPEHPLNGTKLHNGHAKHPFTVQKLAILQGQYIDAGASLCTLMDFSELYVEGQAFEQDAEELLQAARSGWSITATYETADSKRRTIRDLKIVYVDNEIEPISRALRFYVRLPNEVVYENRSNDGHRFLTWQYKPGQRMQLLVPVETWDKRIVLPVDAVVKVGVENYIFQQNGDHFDRVPVHVEYRDQLYVVIENDGSVFPGDTVAISGAHQMQMALKNKSGGAVDPHAGHNH